MGRIIQIVARNEHNVIADFNNKIPFDCKSDMAFFYNLSLGKQIVCGRRTFELLPPKVQERVSAVFTTNRNYRADKWLLHDITDFMGYCDYWLDKSDVLIIGGQKVYDLTFNRTEEVYVTDVIDSKVKEGYSYDYDLRKEGFGLNWKLRGLIDEKTGVKFMVSHWVGKWK